MDTGDATEMLHESELSLLLQELLPEGAVGAARRIRPDDDGQLRPPELPHFQNATRAVQCASGAARAAARSVAPRLGVSLDAIPNTPDRAPIWPAELVGSLAHDAEFAIAALALAKELGGLGIDVEPIQPLKEDLAEMVADAEEIAQFGDRDAAVRALFSIKEAVYKAVHPRDGVFLDFKDVRVERESGEAVTSYGRRVHWTLATTPRILAVAWVPLGEVVAP